MVEGSVVTAVLVTGLGPGEDRQRNCAQYMDPAHVRLRGKSSTYSDQNMGPECVSRSLAAIGPSLPRVMTMGILTPKRGVFLVRALEYYAARASTTINGDKCP